MNYEFSEKPNNRRFIDLENRRFGNWFVLGYTGKNGTNHTWLCKCECGAIKNIYGSNLRKGVSKSCGCLRKIINRDRMLIHGLSKNRIYEILIGMRSRCYCEDNPSYKNYGGRGIKVYEEWLNNFNSFVFWANNNGYKDNLTIERLDNNGDYCPENCIWIPRSSQNRNKRNNRHMIIFGERKTVREWSRDSRCAVSHSALSKRIIDYGMDGESAMITPAYHRQGSQYNGNS